MPALACVIEGHGEVTAVPELVRRIAAEIGVFVDVPRPVRLPRAKFTVPEELRRAVTLALAHAGGHAPVLLLADADDDCAATLGANMVAAAGAVPGVVAVGAVLAVREYEAWFLAAARSLAGARGLVADLVPPEHPETVRGAKEWLRKRCQPAALYAPTVDQAALTAVFDLEEAMSSRSFRKCCKEIERLLRVAVGTRIE